jgi:hypothetical protein
MFNAFLLYILYTAESAYHIDRYKKSSNCLNIFSYFKLVNGETRRLLLASIDRPLRSDVDDERDVNEGS